MNFPFYIARRYLFSKKSHNAINVISAISVCGVALATLALVCTLSVFNGFQDLVTTFFTAFDPQLKITAVRGKVFDGQDKRVLQLKKNARRRSLFRVFGRQCNGAISRQTGYGSGERS